MTLPEGEKRTWLLPIVLSLLLHIPIALLLSRLPMINTYSEPVLKLSLRPTPAVPKIVRTSPQTTSQKQELQSKPQYKPVPQKAAARSGGQKTHTENQGSYAPKNGGSETAADRQATASEPFSGVSGSQVQPQLSVGPVEASTLKILKQVIPDYPAFSRKRGEEGRVRVIALIKGGAVIEVEIYESSGFPRLDRSALRAARAWRFAETEELRVIIPFLFSLTD